MLRARIIPCLLLRGHGLVKTVRFAKPNYLGDPVNAVKIFNDKGVDELALLDITATVENRRPPFQLISEIASECFMPLAYGGAVRSVEDIRTIFGLGVEKVVLNTIAYEKPQVLEEAAKLFGEQSLVASIDVKQGGLFRKRSVYVQSGRKCINKSPVEYARELEQRGAGEILLNNIDRDGTMEGYDLELIAEVTSAVKVPVIALGGAGSTTDLGDAIYKGGASGAGAGSLFVYQGKSKGILINFPSPEQIKGLHSAGAV